MSRPLDLAARLGSDARRLESAPQSFVTRRVPREALRCLCGGDLRPQPGDLVLAEIERLGHHTRLHLPDGRRRQLFVGDAVVLAYANRYASSQYEAVVPSDLGPCHLAAGGGIAGRVVERHHGIRGGITTIRPLGLVAERPGEPPLNVASFARPRPPNPQPRVTPVFAFLGGSMDAGKTTAAAHLARGLSQLGKRVGYAKVTGTVAAGDPGLLADAGAEVVLDMADAGYASTYGIPREALEEIFLCLLGHLQGEGVDAALIEVADGLLQPETAALLASERFDSLLTAIFFAARDAMGAVAGADRLRGYGQRVVGLTGTIEASPLDLREATATTGLPFFARRDLSDAHTVAKLLESVHAA